MICSRHCKNKWGHRGNTTEVIAIAFDASCARQMFVRHVPFRNVLIVRPGWMDVLECYQSTHHYNCKCDENPVVHRKDRQRVIGTGVTAGGCYGRDSKQ